MLWSKAAGAGGTLGGSEGWDISTASFVHSFSVGGQELTPQGVFFKADGTAMYITGNTGDDVNQYSLSTAWDISTASFVQNSSLNDSLPLGLFFKADGTKMYAVGSQYDSVYEYSLSTAWDISTKTLTRSLSVASQETLPTDVFFKPDGTRMYVLGYNGADLNEYVLATGWNISTAFFVQSFSVAGQEATPQGAFISPDGTRLYVTGSTGDDVNQYGLSTAWDISTASFVQNFSVSDTTPSGVFFKSDGTKMYVSGDGSNLVYEYNVSS